MNVTLIEECISNLLQFGQCDIAQFDFATSCPKDQTVRINLNGDSIAIIEGIHALNPIFTKHIKSVTGLKKIYISVKQGIREPGHTGYLLTAAELTEPPEPPEFTDNLLLTTADEAADDETAAEDVEPFFETVKLKLPPISFFSPGLSV